MKMKAMKFLKYILVAVLPLAFTACVEEQYTPGNPDRWDCQGLFFPQDQKTDYVIAPNESHVLTFTVQREVIDEAAAVPFIINASEEGIFTMEDEALMFEESQSSSKFRVTVSSEAELGKKYTCSIKVTDPQYVSAYGLSSNELTFSVTVVEWKQIKGKNGEEKGLWRDDLFTSWGLMLGAPLVQPYAEKEVAIFERSDLPNYFRVSNVYTPEYVSYIYAGDNSAAADLANYCPGLDLYIDATNPDKVYMETQFGLYDPFLNYGAIYFCSDVQENFDAGYSNLYGTYKNGVIEFKTKNSIVLYLPSAGAAFGNASGKTRLVLPGHKGYDYSVAVNTLEFKSEGGENVLPLQFTVGSDVKKVKYQVFEGNLSNVELVSALEEVKTGNSKEITASTVLDFTAPATNFYTLIACSYDADGGYQEYDYVSFGYDTTADPRDVNIHLGLVVSDKHGATGRTAENSMEFYIYGKDINDAKLAIYEDFHSSIDSLVQYYMPSLDVYQLDSLNKVGYTGLIDGLAPGVEYTIIAYANNGYHDGIFTATASTEGEYTPLDEQFQFYDMPSELQPVSQEDYFKQWNLWSVDPFNTEDWTRTNRGKVSFAEGVDLLFNKNGEQLDPNKFKPGDAAVDPTKTMEVITLSGMFPTIKEKYNLQSDAIDFHYYDGYIYSLMTSFGKTKVDNSEAFPATAYLLYDGQLLYYDSNFAILGGFVRNPIEKDSKDVIALVGNPSVYSDCLGMAMSWYKDAGYEQSGGMFNEDVHSYPILINPESEFNEVAGVQAVARASASQQTLSKMINAGQTNCVETADGFIKSTIDNFKSLPYNYMENLTDVKVTFEHPVADYSVSESKISDRQPASFKKATFVERVLR